MSRYDIDHLPEETVFSIVRQLWEGRLPVATIALNHHVDFADVRKVSAWMALSEFRRARDKLRTQAKRFAKRQKLRTHGFRKV